MKKIFSWIWPLVSIFQTTLVIDLTGDSTDASTLDNDATNALILVPGTISDRSDDTAIANRR